VTIQSTPSTIIDFTTTFYENGWASPSNIHSRHSLLYFIMLIHLPASGIVLLLTWLHHGVVIGLHWHRRAVWHGEEIL
jgi:hypothetical protein